MSQEEEEYHVKLIAIVSLLFSAVSYAQTTTYINAQNQYFEETQGATRAVPTESPVPTAPTATKPLLLNRWTSYRISVCPAEGYALDGTGSIRLYIFNHRAMSTGRWGYDGSLDLPINITGSVVDMCQYFGLPVDVRKGFLLPATIGVGFTGGGTVTVRIDPDNSN